MSYIAENLKEINKRIKEAAEKSGRKPEDITLIGVSKTIDLPRIEELLALGVNNLGENKVQEFLPKYEALETKAPIWHFIGHLQTNKVKFLVGKANLIHSVDNIRLAEQINKYSEKIKNVTEILIEINIANEPTKSGISPESAEEFVKSLSEFEFIKVTGLMTVAPNVDNCEKNRIFFTKMHNIFVDIRDKYANNIDMKHLSMGMTNDYTVAIEEGADIIRIGTGIFGHRDYDIK